MTFNRQENGQESREISFDNGKLITEPPWKVGLDRN